jgi:hypothetical protein
MRPVAVIQIVDNCLATRSHRNQARPGVVAMLDWQVGRPVSQGAVVVGVVGWSASH